MSGDHPLGTTFGGDERAQTIQDFAVGISIFLLVVGAVFLVFPSLFAPYEQAIADEGPSSQADRISMLIADNVTGANDTTNNLTHTELNYWFNNTDLNKAVGVSSTTQVNVTLTNMSADSDTPIDLNYGENGNKNASTGPDPGERDTSTAARIVTIGDSATDSEAEPAYRLVVRVW